MDKPKASTALSKKYQSSLKIEPSFDILSFDEFRRKDMKIEIKKMKEKIKTMFIFYLVSIVFLSACLIIRAFILHL